MKIAILLGSPEISGGTYVIFEHATRLNRKGDIVSIVTEHAVIPERYSWHPSARELTWRTFADLEGESFDLTIATWWQSVFLLQRIKSRKYLYFIQSIESRFFPAQDSDDFALRDIDVLRDWCENTYKIALPVITEATWIQNYLLKHHNRPSFLVRNGIRKDVYFEGGTKVGEEEVGIFRVLVEGPLGVFYKNVEKTIELCCQAGVQSIWLLTSSIIESYPGVERCFSRVPIQETAEIYRSCDVLVKLSYVEGMFGPPLEMFHCGGTAIVYDVTGHDEYIRHGENSLVVKKDDEAKVVEWLEKLQNDPTLLEKLKLGAKITANNWPDWDKASEKFRLALEEIDKTFPEMSSSFLKENSDFLLSVRENTLRARELSRMAQREACGVVCSSTRFQNYIQVYWDGGEGILTGPTDNYQSGSWQQCSVVIPCDLAPKGLRVDPSVLIGVVEIRSLKISGDDSGEIFAHWRQGSNWDEIMVAGTACPLRMDPYPMLEAYGEDPQLFLPPLPNIPDKEHLRVEIEVREMSFAQIFAHSGCIGKKTLSPQHCLKNGKTVHLNVFLKNKQRFSKILKRVRSLRSHLGSIWRKT